MSVQFGTMALHCAASKVVSVTDAVKGLVLDWSIRMEEAGITGDGVSFSKEERRAALDTPTTIHIGSIGAFSGNLGAGNASGDISMRSVNVDGIKSLIDQARSNIDSLEGVDRAAIEARLSELEEEIEKAVPSQSRVRATLAALQGLLVEASGNLVAAGILSLIQQLS